MFLLLLIQLDCQLVIVLLGGLLLRDEFLDLDVFVALELGLESLDGEVFPREGLFLELLVFDLGHALGLSQLVLLLTEVLGDVLQLLHLDLLHLQVHSRIENLITQLSLLGQTRLVVGQTLDLGLHCVAILGEFLNALFLVFNESSIELDLELMTGLSEVIECLVLNQVHFVVILLCGLAPMFGFMHAEVIFGDRPLIVKVFHLSVEVELAFAVYGLILELLLFDLVVLRYHDIDLRVEHELLPDYFELKFVELLDFLVIVATHLLILLFEERYVLEAGLFVVKKTADAGFLLIFNHFLLQDLKLQLHEVDLLLEVRDVLILSLIHI